MDHPPKPKDALEDHCFSILMDAFAELEGERLLAENEELIFLTHLPEEIDARMIRAIDGTSSHLRWRKLRIGRHILSRARFIIKK